MMKRRTICLLTALCLLTVMSGCARKGTEETEPVNTLAPASVEWEAPDGDRAVGLPGEYVLYVPEKNQPKLGIRSVRIERADLRETAEESAFRRSYLQNSRRISWCSRCLSEVPSDQASITKHFPWISSPFSVCP